MFPLTRYIKWDAPTTGGAPDGYRISVNGALIATVGPTVFVQQYDLPGPGVYTASIIPFNTFGDGPAAQAVLSAQTPGVVVNARWEAVP
jgi:hypothetical protein